jgi:hypothetical protein
MRCPGCFNWKAMLHRRLRMGNSSSEPAISEFQVASWVCIALWVRKYQIRHHHIPSANHPIRCSAVENNLQPKFDKMCPHTIFQFRHLGFELIHFLIPIFNIIESKNLAVNSDRIPAGISKSRNLFKTSSVRSRVTSKKDGYTFVEILGRIGLSRL